jgi:hypothetical protein
MDTVRQVWYPIILVLVLLMLSLQKIIPEYWIEFWILWSWVFIVMFRCPESWMRSLEVCSGCVESDPSSRPLTNKYLIMKVRKEHIWWKMFSWFFEQLNEEKRFPDYWKRFSCWLDFFFFCRNVFILFPPFSTYYNTMIQSSAAVYK